eukprot:m.245091 g.245091  ORF g.245091 m.245091 type:complete len:393 (+) comp33833_c12_seq1:19-1197(+)
MSTSTAEEDSLATSANYEDFSDIEGHDILSIGGTDAQGNPVFCFKAANLPSDPKVDFDKLLRYMLHRMDELVESDYSIVWLHHGWRSKNKPPLKWIRQMHSGFSRKYRKNLKALYFVHYTSFIKILMTLCKPFISSKFFKKVHLVKTLTQLESFVDIKKLSIPEIVASHDLTLKIDSKDRERLATLKQKENCIFGGKLTTMKVNEQGMPQVFVDMMEFINKHGLDTEGIFRRSVSLKTLNEVKAKYNAGEQVSLETYDDPQLAAALMKGFFRELVEPLFTFALYDKFIAISDMSKDAPDEKMEACKAVLLMLPDIHLKILSELSGFLFEISKHEENNKMSMNNLAIVFGPNVMKSSDEAASFLGTGKINTLFRYILENQSSMFPLPKPPPTA